MQRNFSHRTLSVNCTKELLNPTFVTVAHYEDVAAKFELITSKNWQNRAARIATNSSYHVSHNTFLPRQTLSDIDWFPRMLVHNMH